MNLSPFQNSKWVIAAIVALLVLIGVGAVTKCRADELHYMQLSAGSTVARGPALVLDLQFAVPASVLKGSSWQFGTSIWSPSQYQGREVGNNFAWYARWVNGFGRFDFGLGAAYLQDKDVYNGAHTNFNLMAAYRFHFPITVTYQHFSDAGTTHPNLGRDMVLVGWRFE